MARDFPETAHLNTDKKKFDEGHERIFGKRKSKPVNRIHKLNTDSMKAMCGATSPYKVEATQTDEDVTCKNCQKIMRKY